MPADAEKFIEASKSLKIVHICFCFSHHLFPLEDDSTSLPVMRKLEVYS